eukprot:15102126-Alexandrium_andersonii.AAC.1
MGGSLSEPATLVDLGRHVHDMYSRPEVLQRAGLAFERLRADQIIGGVSHVDDALVFSGVWCAA